VSAVPFAGIGFHTDAFNSSYWNFDQCVRWGAEHGFRFIECGVIDGVSWIHGLGYQPHLALWEDPLLVRRRLDRHGLQLSQIDAAFPLSLPTGASLGVQYVWHAIRWAHLAGCPCVDTTDDRHRPEGLTDDEAIALLRANYRQIVPVAAAHGVVVNVEPHGYYTTKPAFLARILEGFDPEVLRVNLDTGNTFIAGQDPVAFLERFRDRIGHVHVKDVGAALAAASRGQLTGIAVSPSAIGDGVAAPAIRDCLRLLWASGYQGVLSLESEGEGGPLLERGLRWTQAVVRELQQGKDLPAGAVGSA
jgi:sugar phosphate isomerase/epimerase